MTDDLAILVTGGSSGIGASVARQLLERDHRVAVTGRDAGRLDRLAESLGRPAGLRTFTGDAADYDDVVAAVDATVKEFGRLDAVVANAAFSVPGDIATGDPAQWREMVLTNVLGPALLVRAALPALKETRGRIVFIGSVAGYIASPGNLYGATKWAVTGLADNTRQLVTGDGIGVTLIAPGRVDTAFWDVLGGPPTKNLLTADQVAASVVWALSQPDGVEVNTLMVRPTGQQN